MAKIVVVGGGGFIGAHLAEVLIAEGHQVRILQRGMSDGLRRLQQSIGVEVHFGDFGNAAVIDSALEGQDFVYHLACTTLPKTSNEVPGFDVLSNVAGSIGLLEAAVKHRIKRVIFTSSGGTVYGKPATVPIREDHPNDPICSYGISKLAIEKYLSLFSHLHGLNYTIVRIANPYGRYQRADKGQGAIAVFLERAQRSLPIEIWGDGQIVRDFVYISDVVEALSACLNYDGPENVFNLGGGRGFTLNEVIAVIEHVLDTKIAVTYLPARTLDVATNILDNSRITRALKWSPRVNLRDGIELMTRPS